MINFYQRGNPCYWNEADVACYMDGTPLPDNPADERPCIKCGQSPTPEGYDACLGHIPGVFSACCGHGVENGYILWQAGGIKHPFADEPTAETEIRKRVRLCWLQRKRRKDWLPEIK